MGSFYFFCNAVANIDWTHLMGRSISWRLRLLVLLLALPIATAIVWAELKPAPMAGAATVPPAPHGSFRPTPNQWAALKVVETKTLAFQSTVVTDGSIAFNDDATTAVFSPYSGRVTRLIAKLGDVVKKGAPLMAMVASEIVQGQSDVASAKAARDTALAVEQRQHDLYDAGATAMKDWRQAQSDLVAAEGALSAARGRLQILGKSATDIETLEQAPAAATETMVVAPIDGTVIQRQVGVGQYITSAASGAANPVYTIGNLSSVWLVANVRETDAPFVHVGQEAEVTLPAFPGQTFKAKISWVGASVDANTHRLPVRAEVRNPDGLLKPQMFARFSIATSAPRLSPAVPQSAIVYEGDSARVYVAQDNATIVARPIRIDRSRDGMIEAVSGLHAGEKIVTAGTLFIDRAAEGQ
jgi:cobalt-zinc-cadmium efflux system membrane fusion protein